MAKTDPIIAPRHLVVANLDGEFRKRPGLRRYGDLLGCDDRGQRIVTTNTNAHEDTPEDDETDHGHGGRSSGQRLGKSGEDDEDEFKAVHPLTPDQIRENTKAYLAKHSAS